MSIIIQNVIGPNTSIKRQKISHWIKKAKQETNFKDTKRVKVKE